MYSTFSLTTNLLEKYLLIDFIPLLTNKGQNHNVRNLSIFMPSIQLNILPVLLLINVMEKYLDTFKNFLYFKYYLMYNSEVVRRGPPFKTRIQTEYILTLSLSYTHCTKIGFFLSPNPESQWQEMISFIFFLETCQVSNHFSFSV